MKKYAHEFKVGIFIILCAIGLGYLTFSTGKVSFGKEGYDIFVVFNELAGLNIKAPVMLNGFEVGKVEDIKLSYDNEKTLITLKLRLNKGVLIREDSEMAIKTLGMMGEKYVQITSSVNSNFLPAQATVIGKPYADIDKLVTDLNQALGQNKDRIDNIAKSLEVSSRNFEFFSEDIKRHPWKLLIKTRENK